MATLQALVDAPKGSSTALDELMTLVQFANDEGDYGEGLELGLDLLAFHPIAEGSDVFEKASLLNKRISWLLSCGYQLAGRSKFAEVVKRHMENRLKLRTLRVVM